MTSRALLGGPARVAAQGRRPAVTGQDTGSRRECRAVELPVALAPGQPADERMVGSLSVPVGRSPNTIQLLVHGTFTSGHHWDFPDPSGGTDRYNYVAAANDAGFATLAIDRIGCGGSSHPPSTSMTAESNAFSLHQIVEAIRRGEICGPAGRRFQNVVFVGHSYGALVGWYLASDHGQGIDAAVFASATHTPTVTSQLLMLPRIYPAAFDPKFAGDGLDLGYLTCIPGTWEVGFHPAQFDSAVAELDERLKSTATITELVNPELNVRPLDVRVPTLLAAGDLDPIVSRENFDDVPALGGRETAEIERLVAPFKITSPGVPGVRLGGADCSSPEALLEGEGPHLGAHVPSIDAFVLAGAAHNLNLALNAQEYFTAVNGWIAEQVGR